MNIEPLYLAASIASCLWLFGIAWGIYALISESIVIWRQDRAIARRRREARARTVMAYRGPRP